MVNLNPEIFNDIKPIKNRKIHINSVDPVEYDTNEYILDGTIGEDSNNASKTFVFTKYINSTAANISGIIRYTDDENNFVEFEIKQDSGGRKRRRTKNCKRGKCSKRFRRTNARRR
jgi:hypothetical protein